MPIPVQIRRKMLAAMEAAIEAVSASVWWLPPYSSDLNPIGKLWSKIKSWLRRAAADTRQLDQRSRQRLPHRHHTRMQALLPVLRAWNMITQGALIEPHCGSADRAARLFVNDKHDERSHMTTPIAREIDALHRMTTGELAERYEQLHGQPVRTRHRAYLIRKIAWRIQANAEGDLTERARRRAAEL
ncbi:MAG TPA: DUF2924 domain-containing protein, partial [Phycisphaeraceae bacterium]|nr:DUF2924 domain-containing protein [Phycisphaeraceae bacterium]